MTTDQGKLKWFRNDLFAADRPRSIAAIHIDDPTDFLLVDVHVCLDDGSKWWTTCSTPEKIGLLLLRPDSSGVFAATGTLILTEISGAQVEKALFHLQNQGRLIESLNPWNDPNYTAGAG